MDQDQKKCECGMPLSEDTTCECAGDKCVHCCCCEDDCQCGCKEKAAKEKAEEK